MSQADDILAHLRTGKPLDPLTALEEFGCFRLGARVHDLKQLGYDIQATLRQHPRTGKRYAEYRLNASGAGAGA